MGGPRAWCIRGGGGGVGWLPGSSGAHGPSDSQASLAWARAQKLALTGGAPGPAGSRMQLASCRLSRPSGLARRSAPICFRLSSSLGSDSLDGVDPDGDVGQRRDAVARALERVEVATPGPLQSAGQSPSCGLRAPGGSCGAAPTQRAAARRHPPMARAALRRMKIGPRGSTAPAGPLAAPRASPHA